MHDPELRALAGCRRPGLFALSEALAVAARRESSKVLTLCLTPDISSLGV
jgi:hypothetical protein